MVCNVDVCDQEDDFTEFYELDLEDILFDSKDCVEKCLGGHVYLESDTEEYGEKYGEPVVGWTSATVSYNEKLGLYVFSNDNGVVAMAKLDTKLAAIWSD